VILPTTSTTSQSRDGVSSSPSFVPGVAVQPGVPNRIRGLVGFICTPIEVTRKFPVTASTGLAEVVNSRSIVHFFFPVGFPGDDPCRHAGLIVVDDCPQQISRSERAAIVIESAA